MKQKKRLVAERDRSEAVQSEQRGIVLTMYDGRTNIAKQVQDEVRKHFDNTFRSVIPRSVRLSEAPSHGMPIQIYTVTPDPRDPANLERPCGRGLLLMRTFMDLVEYNSTGNQVTLVKRSFSRHSPSLSD